WSTTPTSPLIGSRPAGRVRPGNVSQPPTMFRRSRTGSSISRSTRTAGATAELRQSAVVGDRSLYRDAQQPKELTYEASNANGPGADIAGGFRLHYRAPGGSW